jgi:DNA-binding Lrp family transcriptional regulator
VITVFVQVRCSRDLIPETARAIAELPGIDEVYSVSGDWDLVAIARLRTHDEVAELVTERMVTVPGIVRTNTISAFRVYSRRERDPDFTS